MTGLWTSPAGMKKLAGGLLALALVAIGASYLASQKAVAIQGPGAMHAIDDQTLWLGVNEELWVLDRAGRRVAQRSTRELGLRAGISNIVLAREGLALLTSRRDAHWQLVDRSSLKPVRTIRPQWPAEFADNHTRAIHLAMAPDGDVAVATGGGHAVLLFDGEGRFKGRTAAGTYHFTNGIWWSPEGWWTTDTNRFALHLLDAKTLAVKNSVPLRAAPAGYPYLAEAQPSRGRMHPETRLAPLATVTRVGYLMEPGHAVDIFPDGSQLLFNLHPLRQLRDMTWFGEQLLLVDGATYTVQRFGADRIAEEPFGDGQVKAAFSKMRQDRAFWSQLGSRYVFLLAATLLLLGIAAHVRHKRLVALAQVAARQGGHAVAIPAPLKQLATQRLWIYGLPVAIRAFVVLASLVFLYPWLHLAWLGPAPDRLADSLRLLVLCMFLPVLPVALWQQWRHERLSARPEFESALNHRAIAWLREHDDFDRVKLEGEMPRETVFMPGWRSRWLLVTNRRVLLFAASARERHLVSEWSRRAVVVAGAGDHLPPQARLPGWQRLFRLGPNLGICFTSGTVLRLRCASSVTARRAGELLMSSPAIPETDAASLEQAAPRRRWHEVVASFVLPGAGQLLQGRFATGAVLFTAALLLCAFDLGPVLWAMKGPKMDVAPVTLASALLVWLVLALVASSDAHHFSAARRR